MAYRTIFNPKNPQKYAGDTSKIVCRSLWERNVCKFCDDHPNVLKWSSEEIAIPYTNPIDKKIHNYYPDFLIQFNGVNGKQTWMVEVKPKKQTLPPQKKSRVTKSYLHECKTYAVNQAKWKAAVEFCKDRMIEFKVVTEQELFGYK